MGLLTIIVLGESILASVQAIYKVLERFTPELGFLVAGACYTPMASSSKL